MKKIPGLLIILLLNFSAFPQIKNIKNHKSTYNTYKKKEIDLKKYLETWKVMNHLMAYYKYESINLKTKNLKFTHNFSGRNSIFCSFYKDEDDIFSVNNDGVDTSLFGRKFILNFQEIPFIQLYFNGYADIPGITNSSISVIHGRKLHLSGAIDSLSISTDQLRSEIYKGDNVNLFISDLNCKNLRDNSNSDFFLLENSNLSRLSLQESKISKGLKIYKSQIEDFQLDDVELPNKIYLDQVSFRNGKSTLDFTRIRSPVTLKVYLYNVTGEEFVFSPERVQFIVDKRTAYNLKIETFKKILKKIDKSIYPEEFGYYDQQYQEEKLLHQGHYILNWVEKNWWGYGYNSAEVFQAVFWLYLSAIVLNLITFNYLFKVYCPSKIENFILETNIKYQHKSLLNGFIYHAKRTSTIILYTSYIFWGLKLNVERINIKYWPAIFLIFLEYVLGLVCLGYIAHYILAK